MLLGRVFEALKLTTASVRLACELNLLLTHFSCHKVSTFYFHALMRLYEIFRSVPGGAHCTCECLLPCALLLIQYSHP